MSPPPEISCAPSLSVHALGGVPVVKPGDDLAALILHALARSELELRDHDVLVVASKVVSRAEDRFVDLSRIEPSPRAAHLALRVMKDPRLVELVLGESTGISRAAPGVLVVRHRLGFVSAEAGVDFSNVQPPKEGEGPWVLLLPEDPDRSADELRRELETRTKKRIGVVISDSHGRPFRLGSVGVAIGLSGLPAVWDQRGERDLFGRVLEHTLTALGDQIASVADLVAGQAAEGRALVLVRGVRFDASADSAKNLCRPVEQDLYAAPLAEEPEP